MSIHINADCKEVADKILLPGDPLRAKWIAETFLTDVKQYNNVRGMLGYTGFYKENRISVQGTGMGIPSISIYAHELINNFGVKKLIRVGSAGSYQENIKLRDIIIAMAASTNSNFNNEVFYGETFAPTASSSLFLKAIEVAKNKNISIKAGNILSSDIFYQENSNYYKKWAQYGVLCVEMETAALYTIAAKFNVDALSILTISDSLTDLSKKTTAQERETSFREMIEIALEI